MPGCDIILSMNGANLQIYRNTPPVWKTRALTRHDIENSPDDVTSHQVDCLRSLDRVDSHLSPASNNERSVFLAQNKQSKIWHIANLEDSDPLNSYPYEYRYDSASGILEATVGEGFKIDLRNSFAYLDQAIRSFKQPNGFANDFLAKFSLRDSNTESERIQREYDQSIRDYKQTKRGDSL